MFMKNWEEMNTSEPILKMVANWDANWLKTNLLNPSPVVITLGLNPPPILHPYYESNPNK